MSARKRIFGVVGMLVAFAGVVPAFASAIAVGTGSNHAEVYVEFQDGATFTFDVAFDGTTTGLGLLDIIEFEQPFTTERQDFGWGRFVDGIAFAGHSNSGYGGGENWWHYWTHELGTDWASPPYGAADRLAIDGSADGWVYGRGGAPATAPEPTTVGLLIAGVLLGTRRRTRRAR